MVELDKCTCTMCGDTWRTPRPTFVLTVGTAAEVNDLLRAFLRSGRLLGQFDSGVDLVLTRLRIKLVVRPSVGVVVQLPRLQNVVDDCWCEGAGRMTEVLRTNRGFARNKLTHISVATAAILESKSCSEGRADSPTRGPTSRNI